MGREAQEGFGGEGSTISNKGLAAKYIQGTQSNVLSYLWAWYKAIGESEPKACWDDRWMNVVCVPQRTLPQICWSGFSLLGCPPMGRIFVPKVIFFGFYKKFREWNSDHLCL